MNLDDSIAIDNPRTTPSIKAKTLFDRLNNFECPQEISYFQRMPKKNNNYDPARERVGEIIDQFITNFPLKVRDVILFGPFMRKMGWVKEVRLGITDLISLMPVKKFDELTLEERNIEFPAFLESTEINEAFLVNILELEIGDLISKIGQLEKHSGQEDLNLAYETIKNHVDRVILRIWPEVPKEYHYRLRIKNDS